MAASSIWFPVAPKSRNTCRCLISPNGKKPSLARFDSHQNKSTPPSRPIKRKDEGLSGHELFHAFLPADSGSPASPAPGHAVPGAGTGTPTLHSPAPPGIPQCDPLDGISSQAGWRVVSWTGSGAPDSAGPRFGPRGTFLS